MRKFKVRFKVQRVSTVTGGVIEEVTIVEKMDAQNVVDAYRKAKELADERTRKAKHEEKAIKGNYAEIWKLKAIEMI